MARTLTPRAAERRGQWIKMAVVGEPGGGKTFTALQLARSLENGTGTVVIDTEPSGPNDSWASDNEIGKFGDWRWDVAGWPEPYSMADLADPLHALARQYGVVIIDSISPFWDKSGGYEEAKAAIARKDYKNNQWAATSDARKLHYLPMLEAILTAPCHVLVCVRAHWGSNLGSMEPTLRINFNDEFEHEMGMSVFPRRDDGHALHIRKSRVEWIRNGDILTPGQEQLDFGDQLKEWCQGAVAVEPYITPAQATEITSALGGIGDETARGAIKRAFVDAFAMPNRVLESQLDDVMDWIAQALAGDQIPPSPAPVAPEEPPADPAPEAASEPAEPPQDETEAEGADVKALRNELAKVLIEDADTQNARKALEAEGLWPTIDIPAESLNEALDLAMIAAAGETPEAEES